LQGTDDLLGESEAKRKKVGSDLAKKEEQAEEKIREAVKAARETDD